MRSMIPTLFALIVWVFAAVAPAHAATPPEPTADAFSEAPETRPPPAATTAEPQAPPPAAVHPSPSAEPAPEPELAGPPLLAQPNGALIVPGAAERRPMPPPPVNFVVDGFYCYDSAGGLPDAGEIGRIVVLWPCDSTPRQMLTLKDGVLFVGPDLTAQITIDIKPWYFGCFERNNYSEKRFYTIGACADDTPVGQTRLEANFTDPNASIIRGHINRGEDLPAPGRPIIAAPISAERPALAQWEYLETRALVRMIGTNLCITPPLGDSTRGAVLTLDDCDEPMMHLDGRPGPSDGRARIDPKRHMWFRNVR